jgi:UDP-N-acetylmuramoylalanine--D-glutamate ligase
VLIAGGQGKGQDFSRLRPAVAAGVKAICLIGQDAPLLRQALTDAGVQLVDSATLPEAVQAQQLAVEGDTVLLSPACASLDMFKNYQHRAAVFIDAVHALAAQQEQPKGQPA